MKVKFIFVFPPERHRGFCINMAGTAVMHIRRGKFIN